MEMREKLKHLALRLQALALLRGLLQNEVLAAFLKLCEAVCSAAEQPVECYGRFVAALYEAGGDFGVHLEKLLLESENPAVKMHAKKQPLSKEMHQCLQSELALLGELAALPPKQLAETIAEESGISLPAYASTQYNYIELYTRRLQQVAAHGYGMFAACHMFTVGRHASLRPVQNPDPQRLAELTGYKREREKILINTKALLRGLPANNILLYGDAGTGKSSTVKAIANEYKGNGLRLVEVRKNQLYQIPLLMDTLAENPLKFILFIDDLSFPADDRDFTTLKAILEGNVSARPRNVVVYATSNRRHMIKERFSDRQGDDLHLGDTLEEEASLAARFGLTVTFLKPDRELYMEIVQQLAKEYGLTTPAEQLLAEAEAHAIRHGGRSPRTAKQFVEFSKAAETENAARGR